MALVCCATLARCSFGWLWPDSCAAAHERVSGFVGAAFPALATNRSQDALYSALMDQFANGKTVLKNHRIFAAKCASKMSALAKDLMDDVLASGQ